ncbi:MAG: hypothetical protein JSV76_00500 [Candidatus Bathyarchaeota archaeon]|nr:MAG: hypothetical protein JSV76_00500 [Candidatus Bathyarchaeota archaeon]
MNSVPEEFNQKSEEFWSYVEEKLDVYKEKVCRVYREEIWNSGSKGLKQLKDLDTRNYQLIKKLIKNGAHLEATEDKLLVYESKAWAEAIRREHNNFIIHESYMETLQERAVNIAKRIEETLGDGELGVLFIEPRREIQFDKSIKVIKMYRFNPLDELKKWQIQRRYTPNQ